VSPVEAGLIHAGIRASQFCAMFAVVLAFFDHWWLGLVLVPVAALLVWSWQVLYENVP
jgi:fatty acid desaturase